MPNYDNTGCVCEKPATATLFEKQEKNLTALIDINDRVRTIENRLFGSTDEGEDRAKEKLPSSHGEMIFAQFCVIDDTLRVLDSILEKL